MLKKIISMLAMTAMFVSFIPAAYAEDSGDIDVKITFEDEYSVIGDNLRINVEITAEEEKNNVDVSFKYGETSLYTDKINLNEENKFKFTKETNTVIGVADKFTVTVNSKAHEKEIIKKDAFEIGNIDVEYKQTVTENETEYLEYSINAAAVNNRNVKAEKLVLSYGAYATEEFETEAKSSADKEFAVKIKKSDISDEKLNGKLKLTVNGEEAAEKETEFKNPYYVSGIIVNSGKKIVVAKGENVVLNVALEPVSTISDYEISSEDEDIVSVGEDKKSITGVKEGKTKITVKAGKEKVSADVEVLRDRTEAEPENIQLYYYKNEEEKKDKTDISFSEVFSYATGSYTVTLPKELETFKLYYKITEGNLSKIETTKKNSGKTETANVYEDGNGEKYVSWSSRFIKLSFKFKGDDSNSSEYVFTIGNAPEIPEFPEEINVYSDFDKNSDVDFTLNLQLNRFAEEPSEISDVEVFDENGNEIGKYREEGDEDSTKRYWIYEISKKTKEGTRQPAVFKFKNKYGMETVCETVLVYCEDTEDPEWKGDAGITRSSVTSSSAQIKWSHATDNDQISYYILHYYKNSSSASEKTSKVKYDSTEKPSVSLSSLSAGTTYKVYLEAFDRSGNYCKSDTESFTTSKSSTSGSGSGGSSGSSGSSSGSISGNSAGNVSGSTNTSGTTNGGVSQKLFNDIENYGWAKKEIETLTQKKIISGISETEYGPAMNIRRCDFILLLCRAYGFNGTFEENFSDVPNDAYYANAVGLAKQLGILTGMGNNEFNPNGYITRQDMCVMALRAMKAVGKNITDTADISKFADCADIAEYAEEAFAVLTAAGIINGDENGNANPRKNTTRAEAAVIIYRLLNI